MGPKQRTQNLCPNCALRLAITGEAAPRFLHAAVDTIPGRSHPWALPEVSVC